MNFDFNYDWATWSRFFEENWFVLVIALILLLVIVGIVKTVVKWLLVAVVVIAVVVYSGYNLEDLKSIGEKVTDTVKQEALNAMVGEALNATYIENGDGTFTVKTDNLELQGVLGENEVKVSFRGAPLGTWKIDDTIRDLIDKAKQNV
ncbi:hypothetical protein ABEV74_06390 [Paenibacillus cisolokensis]|uniref:hypothetical protein n=1 Tax=Paenibacillus TaxID=44249 RepID=UPI0007221059|nr:hypothetical protein [Paenibacillus sp. 32O-W]ALS26737.1 hypothetical protein IJ21_13330 [Paenibacillus sp. 32O-W]